MGLIIKKEPELREERLIFKSRAMRFASLSRSERKEQMRMAAEPPHLPRLSGSAFACLWGGGGSMSEVKVPKHAFVDTNIYERYLFDFGHKLFQRLSVYCYISVGEVRGYGY